MISSNQLITTLLITLCSLALIDLWRQLSLKGEQSWLLDYIKAVKSRSEFWQLGFRLEDLELKLEYQDDYWKRIKHQIDTALAPKFRLDKNTLRQNVNNIAYTRQSRIALHNLLRNDSTVYEIACGENGPLLRIGSNDFRTDSRDCCQIFGSTSYDSIGPLGMFDMIPLKEGSFALRSVANGRFLKAVPPPADYSYGPWKVVVGGSLVGSAESFRLTSDGKLYSSLMGTCC